MDEKEKNDDQEVVFSQAKEHIGDFENENIMGE